MQKNDFEIATQVAHSLLGHPDHLKRISGMGTCNRAFLADRGTDRIIIRLNADRDSREFLKESWCMKQAAAAGVNVARPLRHGVQNDWNYGVQSFEGNVSGAEYPDQMAVWRWLGEQAARCHKIKTDGFGDILTDEKTGKFGGDWKSYVAGNLRSIAEGNVYAHLSRSQVKNLRARLESLAGKHFDFGLCHGDLAPRNVILDGRRMTLIDWGCAHAHIVPHFDFRELLRVHSSDSAEVRAFAAGYGASAKLNGLLPEIENVLLLCAYDVVRWAKDRAPAQLADKEKEFRNFLEHFQPTRER
jgi:fructosamine-3-kinase